MEHQKTIVLILFGLVCVIGVLENDARAGFLEESIGVNFPELPDPPGSGPPSWVFQSLADSSGNGHLVIGELFGPETIFQTQPLYVEVTGVSNTNFSILTFTQYVLNGTNLPWTGYMISLMEDTPMSTAIQGGETNGDTENGYAMFVGDASSNLLTLTGATAHSLSFGSPGYVAVGEVASFTFDVYVPPSGPFDLAVSLTPFPMVPEPASIALVCVGLMLQITRLNRSR